MSYEQNAIELEAVSTTFGSGSPKVLDNVSLTVPEREFLAIVGPSGAGKTTLQAAYGLRFCEYRQMQPEFMYMAAERGDVDVISAYSSEGRLALSGLRLLEEPKQAIPPYDAILLIAPKRAGDHALRTALQPLVGAIDITRMRDANLAAQRANSPATIDETARRLWEAIERRTTSR